MAAPDLLTYLFDGRAHPLTSAMAAWLTSSRRYAAFVAANRDKIRKKLRVTQAAESRLDLRLELETAFRLLQERTLTLHYEPDSAGLTRGPDFAVSYTTRLTFMVEVTRLRAGAGDPLGALPEPPAAGPAAALVEERFLEVICGKLGQLPPHTSNVLLIGTDAPSRVPPDLRASLMRLQKRAEHAEPAFWHRHRLRDRADFFNRFQLLSVVLVRAASPEAGATVHSWVNPQARHPLPARALTALGRSQAGPDT